MLIIRPSSFSEAAGYGNVRMMIAAIKIHSSLPSQGAV
jgi:hypothetical protein